MHARAPVPLAARVKRRADQDAELAAALRLEQPFATPGFGDILETGEGEKVKLTG